MNDTLGFLLLLFDLLARELQRERERDVLMEMLQTAVLWSDHETNKLSYRSYPVEELLNRVNVLDFKIGDIPQPKRSRTQTFVSQLVGIFLETVEFTNILRNNQLADDLELNDAIEREIINIHLFCTTTIRSALSPARLLSSAIC